MFIARAEVTALGPGAQRARFEVEESFRGPTGGVIEIIGRGIGGSCAYGFVQGTRYLVFARRAPDGTWSSFLCSSTAPLTEAGEAITFARGITRDKSRGGSVSGHALAAERTSGGRFGRIRRSSASGLRCVKGPANFRPGPIRTEGTRSRTCHRADTR